MISQENNGKLLKRDGHYVHQKKNRTSKSGLLWLPILFRVIFIMILTLLLSQTPVAGQEPDDDELRFEPLRDHIGETEEVALTVYFIGFPSTLHDELNQAVHEFLNSTSIVDARPWWMPNIPKYGEPDFALAPAPSWLPPELTPPDGMLRYDPVSMTKAIDPRTKRDIWLPNKELVDLVDDFHRNLDIVNNVEHPGALLDVTWRANPVEVRFLSAQVLEKLYTQLEGSRTALESDNPSVAFTLYSYNELFDWLEKEGRIREQRGGATLVFLNLSEFAGDTYTFYAEPGKDVVPAIGNGPVERQYPPAVATNPEDQAVADLMSLVLNGGITQAKMQTALDIKCTNVTTALQAGLHVPRMVPSQPICAQWALEPIRNLLGNKGRRFFVSDSTVDLALYAAGDLSDADLVQRVTNNLFELYRYGVLQQTIKANHVYSEAYELRTLLVDLRFDPRDLCILQKLEQGIDPDQAAIDCETEQAFFPSEQTYEVSDVFDVELATRSLSLFNPGSWTVNFVPFIFGLQPDDSIDPVEAAETKAFIREFLNAPVVPNPLTGELVEIPHFPFYRNLNLLNQDGNLVEITSGWEKGLDFSFSQLLFIEDVENNGLGVYDLIWPDAPVVNERPFHETGKAAVKPLVLFLTPEPDGPLGEKWGTFPVNFFVLAAGFNYLTEFGGGGFWASVSGNEEAGGFYRRDFSQVLPQYVLGREKGAGSSTALGVMPDGTVQTFSTINKRRLEFGAPHWCNQFNASDETQRSACRDFVRTTTTLQAIETLQHGLGYVHSPEPRKRTHFDGELSSISRLYQLLDNPPDEIGILLHQMVNQYTTLGISTVWGQITSDWNGVGPHAGMQASLHRSHVREEAATAEAHLSYAIEKFTNEFPGDAAIKTLLSQAVKTHEQVMSRYDAWEYEEALFSAMEVLSLTDQALTLMGEPDRIYDPLAVQQSIIPLSTKTEPMVGVNMAILEQALSGAATRLFATDKDKLYLPLIEHH